MSFRAIVFVTVCLLAGCGEAAPTTQPTPPQTGGKKSSLPPEVEYDPATATQKYQKGKKTK